jgi:hypothetical protein
MFTLYYSYELYNSNYYKTTNDLTFAINWLLVNLFNNKRCYILVKSYTDNKDESIIDGYIFLDQSLNRLVKTSPFDSKQKTIYSPYDTTLFYHVNNSNLYKLLINFDMTSTSTSTSSYNSSLFQSEPVINVEKKEKVKEKVSIKDMFNNVISSSEKLKEVSAKLNQEDKEDKEESLFSESDDTDESICSEELDEIQKQLDTMLNEKMNIDNLVKEKDDKLSDLRCEDSFDKRLIRKNKEREEENRNIFRANLGVHKKICEKYSRYLEQFEQGEITVEKALEDFISPLFEAKFFVIHYLYLNDMINDSDYENPEDELYELYNILYNSRYNEDYNVPDEFEEIVSSFISFLPDRNILTEDEIHNGLNNNSNNDILFQQIEPEEVDEQ